MHGMDDLRAFCSLASICLGPGAHPIDTPYVAKGIVPVRAVGIELSAMSHSLSPRVCILVNPPKDLSPHLSIAHLPGTAWRRLLAEAPAIQCPPAFVCHLDRGEGELCGLSYTWVSREHPLARVQAGTPTCMDATGPAALFGL